MECFDRMFGLSSERSSLGRQYAAALILGATFLAACAGAEPGETIEEGEGQSFSFTIGAATTSSVAVTIDEISTYFVDEVERRVSEETPHEVDFSQVWGTLVGVGEELDAIASGQLDFGALSAGYHPAELPLHNVTYYVPFDSPDMHVAVEAMHALAAEHEEFARVFPEEYNQTTLAYFGYGDYGLATTFEWEELEDLRGRAIAGVGANLEWLGPTGATPVTQPGAEWYTSFQTGVIEGGIAFGEGVESLRLYEVAEQYVAMGFGTAPVINFNVNNDTWESLPDEVRDIIAEVATETEQRGGDLVNRLVEEGYALMEEEGMRVMHADEALRAEWAELLSHLPQERADEAEASGLPGAPGIRTYIAAQEELGYEFPFDYQVD